MTVTKDTPDHSMKVHGTNVDDDDGEEKKNNNKNLTNPDQYIIYYHISFDMAQSTHIAD